MMKEEDDSVRRWVLDPNMPHLRREDVTVRSFTDDTESNFTGSSSVSSQKLKEIHRKAELMVQAKLFKERKRIEEERLALKLREEQLALDTEIEICNAKVEAYDQLQSGVGLQTPLKASVRGEHVETENSSTQDSNKHKIVNSTLNCTHNSNKLDIREFARELNKPKVEIKTFKGSPLEYSRFVRQFNSKVCENTDSYDERLNYLLQFTEGEAHRIAVGYSNLDSKKGYEATWQEFKERYGDPECIARAYVKKALEWPPVKGDRASDIDNFAIFLRECQFAIEGVNAIKVLEYADNLRQLVQKLPYPLHERWRNIVFDIKNKGEVVKFKDLVDFVRREAKKAVDPVYGKDVLSKPATVKPTNIKGKPGKSFATVTKPTQNTGNKCVFCTGDHLLVSCKEIVKLPLKDRFVFLQSKGLCFACLLPGHVKGVCRNRNSCLNCGRPHPTLLHVDPQANNRGNNSPALKTTTSVAHTGAGAQALPIVAVKLKAVNSDKHIKTYAFLDSGSTATFCLEGIADQLNVEGKHVSINITTMGSNKVQTTRKLTGLEVTSLDAENTIDLGTVYTQPNLPVSVNDLISSRDIRNWPYLENVHLETLGNCEVGLLIGVNVPKAMEPLEVIPSENGGPFAVKTALGWVINGPLGAADPDDCDNITTNYLRIEHVPSLEAQLRNQFDFDFNERRVDDRVEPSCEDKCFLEMVKQTMSLKDSHYTIGLPLRTSEQMPNNKKQAEARLTLLGKRLLKDEEFCKQYAGFMNKIIEEGYAERVVEKDKDVNTGRLWYLPHHGVFHPKKRKIRVVFDCAAKFQGKSLNDNLLSGPNLANTIVGTLLRFRQEKVAIMGDIDSMFYQVRVPERDRDLQRFLWYENGNPKAVPVEYRMNVHLFGSTSSPSCANFALRQTAIDGRGHFSEEVVNTVLRNFYVDDCLKSLETADKAIVMIKDIKKLLKRGGFNISKWISSSKAVMTTIPVSERAKETVDLDLDQDDLPIERALGLNWCAETDDFCFTVEVRDHQLTRRGILSTISSIYDPLGFIAPLLLNAKLISQELCKLQLGWDDDIPIACAKKWTSLVRDIHSVRDFKIPRCFKPVDFGIVCSAELHHFSDASESGYGVVTYLRLVSTSDEVHCAFVIGKSRVAPLKKVTVPRLELTAATVAVRTDKLLREELDLIVNRSVFWTDSMSVLKYINNKTTRFHTFVANRLTIIHEGSNTNDWHYVNTKLNPADLASRGFAIDHETWTNRWIKAPSFLQTLECEWPKTPEECSVHLQQDDPEVKKVKVSSTTATLGDRGKDDLINMLITRYSSWFKLKKGVAWILKVRSELLRRARLKLTHIDSNMKPVEDSKLTTDDLVKAENAIISFVQREVFKEEFASLESKQSTVKRSSTLKKLDPFISNGLLRVGGRLHKSDIDIDSKHQIILPKTHHVSTLILRQIHSDLYHSGRNFMLSRLREKYWIVNAPSAIRKLISKCVICRRQKSNVGEQKMASLPEDRVKADDPPFTNVGVDYFGPFSVKVGRSHVNRYGVLFTCMASRAVHLEIAYSLDTSSYINALRRFIARRGHVTKMRSDNGTNFVGAERELRESLHQWNAAQIQDAMLQQNIDWCFNPPAGSHHGGVWERLIRSVRNAVRSTLKEQVLDDEGLHTLMCEIEYVLNDRPITRMSDQCDDLKALTPNHLLLMKCGSSLPPGLFQKTDNYSKRRWRQIQYLANIFWQRWVREYLPLLQERQKWYDIRRNLTVGDIVLIVDSNAPRNSWPMGIVTETMPDRRGLVRQVKVKTATNELTRPVDKLCILLEADLFDN